MAYDIVVASAIGPFILVNMNYMGIFLQSSVAIAFTSIIPLLVFFLVGPLLFQSSYQPLILSALVSVAVGSLLGDVFFHLIPEIFDLHGDYLRNCGLMLFGVFFFFVGERVLQHYHQGHGHDHVEVVERHFELVGPSDPELGGNDEEDQVELEVLSSEGEARRTKTSDPIMMARESPPARPLLSHPSGTGPAKPMGLLVLTSDFIHNFVDGIAVGISFATSLPVGVSTAVAVLLHEIPHELGDFAILLAAGYSPTTVVICNVLTTISSFLGIAVSLILVVVQRDGSGESPAASEALMPFSTSIKPAILSITAGNFLYIALADLIPELLHTMPVPTHVQDHAGPECVSPANMQRWTRWLPYIQYLGVLFGSLTMLIIKIIFD